MADTKISSLTAYAGTAVVAANDVMPIVDTANTTTKKITVSNLAVPLLTASNGASIVLIESKSASTSATIDFTTSIGSTYPEYLIMGSDITPATDATDLWMRVSEDSGSTFKAGGTDYAYNRFSAFDANAGGGNGTTGDSKIIIAALLSNSSAASFLVRFSAPSGTSRHKLFRYEASYEPSGSTIGNVSGSAVFKLDTNAINGIRFMMSSGNITNGRFTLYGVRSA